MRKEIWEIAIGLNKVRSEEHTSELQSHSEISYAVFCLKTCTFADYMNEWQNMNKSEKRVLGFS